MARYIVSNFTCFVSGEKSVIHKIVISFYFILRGGPLGYNNITRPGYNNKICVLFT